MAGFLGRVFGIAFGTFWHCCTTCRLPFGFDLGLAFHASKIGKHCRYCKHWRVHNIRHLWQVELLQGEWTHSTRGIGTGNLSCRSCRWFLVHVSTEKDTENAENAEKWWISQELQSRRNTCFAGALVRNCAFACRSVYMFPLPRWKIDRNTPGSIAASRWTSSFRRMARSLAQTQDLLGKRTLWDSWISFSSPCISPVATVQ